MKSSPPGSLPLSLVQQESSLDSDPSRFPPSVLVVFSSLCFSFMNTIGRDAAHSYDVSSSVVTMSRGIVQFVLSSLLTFKLSVPKISGFHMSLLALRALLGGAASLCRFSSLSHMKVALASTLFTTTPVFALVFGVIFLHRSVRPRDILAIIFCSSGATLVAYSSVTGISGSALSVTAVITGIGSAASTAAAYVVVRIMGAKVHFILNVLVISIANIIVPIATAGIRERKLPLVLHFFQQEIKRINDWRICSRLLLVGFLGFLGASCLNRALQTIQPSKAATIRSMDIPFNIIVGYVLLAELPSSPLQYLGCALVTVGAYTSAINKAT